jgi:hypothetical protein
LVQRSISERHALPATPSICSRVRVDRQRRAERLHERVVPEEVIAVVMRVHDRHHRPVGQRAQPADRHLADLHRRAGVEHHHARRRDHEDDVGHHPAVLGGRETVGGEHHRHARAQPLERLVGHRGAADEVVGGGGEALHRRRQRRGAEAEDCTGGCAQDGATRRGGGAWHRGLPAGARRRVEGPAARKDIRTQ